MTKKKAVRIILIIIAALALCFILFIGFIRYSNPLIRHSFSSRCDSFEAVTDYLVSMSENYVSQTIELDFENGKINVSAYPLDKPAESADITKRLTIDNELSRHVKKLFQSAGVCKAEMSVYSEYTTVSYIFIDDVQNYKEISYSTNPDKNYGISRYYYSILVEDYESEIEKLNENYVFLHYK